MKRRADKYVPLVLALAVASTFFAAGAPRPPVPIVNASVEQKLLVPKLPDGGLPPVVGVHNIQVFRASNAAPELTDNNTWTYNHHMDLAQWHGRMILAWTNGEKDEDVWPAHELFITSDDGFHWSKPAELFPQGTSTSLRTYFFHAPNGHMLTIAGLRTGTAKLDEAKKGGAVVREIRPDFSLGPVHILIHPPAGETAMTDLPMFDTAGDKPFVEACTQLLANHTFLEQQDYGTLLGANRMASYQNADKNFGKAMCFFHRPDGTLVGLGKQAWTVTSTDEGKTWSAPIKPPSLIAGNAKEWVQKLSDNSYVMVYNPQPSDRFPLVLTTSADAITFQNMRTIHGEVPLQRYEGANKSIGGAQYTRGISEFASDGTSIKGPAAKDLWLVYSSNKEDIWVSHVPVPLKLDEKSAVHDDFSKLEPGPLVPQWNTYSPKWAPVSLASAPDKSMALCLEDQDPYDYAKAERVFAESATPAIRFKLLPAQIAPGATLQIELHAPFGSARPVRLTLSPDGKLQATGPANSTDLAQLPLNQWADISLKIDAKTSTFRATINDKTTADLPFAEPASTLERLTLRTGNYRTIGEGKPPPADTDKLTLPSQYFIKDVVVE